jgi:hypothetical protein
MEFPASRRDRLVMGLSIGALILFIANIATFVKQRFFDGHAQAEHAFVVSGTTDSGVVRLDGTVGKHAWRVRELAGGNQGWSVTSDKLDCELQRLEEEMNELELSLGLGDAGQIRTEIEVLTDGQRRHRYMLKTRGMAERLSSRMRTRRHRDLERAQAEYEESSAVHESQADQEIKVEETEDDTGRKSYRVVVRTASGNNR